MTKGSSAALKRRAPQRWPRSKPEQGEGKALTCVRRPAHWLAAGMPVFEVAGDSVFSSEGLRRRYPGELRNSVP